MVVYWVAHLAEYWVEYLVVELAEKMGRMLAVLKVVSSVEHWVV